MKIFYCFIAIICLLGIACGCDKNSSNEAPKDSKAATKGVNKLASENSPAPDISINSLDGKSVSISELKGKVVLLNFWATWCPPCREEIPSMIKLNAAMSGKPFQMIAVSIDEGGAADVKAFLSKSGFSFPVYFDKSNIATKIYGITGVPESFIIDKNGILVKKVVGAMDWNNPEVLAYLETLMK